MKSKDYWGNRQTQNMWEYMQSAENTAKEVASLYAEASEYLNKELDKIYQKFRSKHGLSQAEADRLLHQLPDDATMQQMMDALRQSQDDTEKAALLAELESPAYRARLERLEAVQKELDGLMQNVYQQEKTITTRSYVDLANEAFTKTIYDVQQRVGLGFSFAKLDPDRVDKLLHSKWSGANYSKRIWHNTQQLAGQLKHELLLNTLTGRTEREAAESLRQRFAAGASEARRLVRTESNFVSNQMQMQAYEECGIERYEYVATLDLRTSPRCRKLDGKRFPISEQQPGTNCPPMHPWCRSTTVCDLSEDERAGMERRARNPETGETELVPVDMTYDDWYKQYVRDNPQAELNEKMEQHRSSDRKQMERYQDLLGKGYAPESLDDFQKMKYGEGDEYGILKAQAKGMTYYNKAIVNESEITKHLQNIAEQSNMNMEGLEYRIKGKDSYLRKIRSNYSPDGNRYEINDILRYTYTAPPDKMVEGMSKAIELNAEKGYNTVKVKNSWVNSQNPYNGVNTILQTPDGQKFEVQYHTPESFEVKNGDMHKLYEKQRLITDTSSQEYIELNDQMFKLSDSMEVPMGIEGVKSYG